MPAVKRAGHVGIYDGIGSDHCGIWVEFDGRQLFRGNTEQLGSPSVPPFSIRETKKIEKYLAMLEKHLAARSHIFDHAVSK